MALHSIGWLPTLDSIGKVRFHKAAPGRRTPKSQHEPTNPLSLHFPFESLSYESPIERAEVSRS